MIFVIPSLLILLIICYISFLITRSFAHPAVIMSGIWSFVLLCLSVVLSEYYYLKPIPIIFILILIIVFCLTSLIFAPKDRKVMQISVSMRPINLIFIIISAVFAYIYVKHQTSLKFSNLNILFDIRNRSLDAENNTSLANFLYLSMVVSSMSLVEAVRNKNYINYLLLFVSSCITMLFAIFTGSKGPPIFFICQIIIIYVLLEPRKQKIALSVGGVLITLFAIVGLMYINLASSNNTNVLINLKNLILDYIAGGTAAFSIYYDQAVSYNGNLTATASFGSLLKIFGIYLESDSIHYPFVSLSSDRSTNVYTFVAPLIHLYGVVGSIIYMFIFGLISGYLYGLSNRSIYWIVFYAIFISNTIVQSFTMNFPSYSAFSLTKYSLCIILYIFFVNIEVSRRRV